MFLLPPMIVLKNSLVNRSKSFQEPGECRKYLSPRSNILIRRNLQDSNSIEAISNHSSVSAVGSTLSEPNVDCSLIQTYRTDVQSRNLVEPNCSCDKKRNGPFYVKILRRMQKLSLQWRQCKKVPRGRSIAQWCSLTTRFVTLTWYLVDNLFSLIFHFTLTVRLIHV